MKILTKLSAVLFFTVAVLSCKNETSEIRTVSTEVRVDQNEYKDIAYKKASFNIEGMTCAMGCAKTIEKRLAKMEGVKMAQVNFEEKTALVEFDEAKLDTDIISNAVSKVNEIYTVHNMKTVESFENLENE